MPGCWQVSVLTVLEVFVAETGCRLAPLLHLEDDEALAAPSEY
jgi:hypothetical protein